MPELTKCTRLKYSSKSFWMGVPEMRTRRGVFKLLRAWYVWFSEFFSLWPFEKQNTNATDESSGRDGKQLGDPYQDWHVMIVTIYLIACPIPGSRVSVLHVFSCCDTHLLKARAWWETWSHRDETQHFHYDIPRQGTSESPPSKRACHDNADNCELRELFPNQSQGHFQLPASGTELLALHHPRSRSSSHSHHLYSELPDLCTLIKGVLHQQAVIQIWAPFPNLKRGWGRKQIALHQCFTVCVPWPGRTGR